MQQVKEKASFLTSVTCRHVHRQQSLQRIMPAMCEEEMIAIISRLENHTIAKHEFFVREGQAANEMAIVFKGAFRMF